MRLPLELLVVLLVTKVVFEPAPGAEFGPASSGDLAVAWAGMLALFAFMYLCSLGGALWSVRSSRRRPGERTRIFDVHSRFVATERFLLVAAYVAYAHFTSWPTLVVHPGVINARMTVIGDDLLVLLPFLLGSLAVWLGNYPASRALSQARWGLVEYLVNQSRGLFFILGPWLFTMAVVDSDYYWPTRWIEFRNANWWVRGIGELIFVATICLFFPFYLIRMWPHRRMPRGPLRERMERLLERTRMRCRDLMVWSTGRGRMSNAAVMGFVPWSRYIVFTDALLDDLDENEVEAVLAHELGHVRYHHMAFYLVFVLTFMMLLLTVYVLLPEAARNSRWTVGIVVVLVVIFCWRVAFGFLSRRFERQADVASCQMVGSPLPLMTSLEKLAAASGGSRTAPNWRHYSVAQRVRYLSRFGFDAEALKEYHGTVRIIKGLAVAAVVLLGALLYREHDQWWDPHRREDQERQLLWQIQQEDNRHKYNLWADLGELRMKMGKYEEAWEAFGKCMEMNAFSPRGHLGRVEISLEPGLEYHDLDVALKLAEEAVTRSERPEYRRHLPRALALLAEVSFRRKDHRRAIELIERALKLDLRRGDPEFVKALQALHGKYLRAAEQAEKARKAERKPRDERPSD